MMVPMPYVVDGGRGYAHRAHVHDGGDRGDDLAYRYNRQSTCR